MSIDVIREKRELPEHETLEPELKEPKMYRVFLLNDDYTPMEFVVKVLKAFFLLTEEAAVMIVLQAHTQGRGMCGVFTREIAETKVFQVNQFSRSNEHPLLCCMEPEQ